MNRAHIVNHRMPGESRTDYRARRRAVNAAIRLHLKGRMSHVSTTPVTLPPAGHDVAVDHAVLAQRYRDLTTITLKSGKECRVGRTKGVPYVRSGPRAYEQRRLDAGRRA